MTSTKYERADQFIETVIDSIILELSTLIPSKHFFVRPPYRPYSDYSIVITKDRGWDIVITCCVNTFRLDYPVIVENHKEMHDVTYHYDDPTGMEDLLKIVVSIYELGPRCLHAT